MEPEPYRCPACRRRLRIDPKEFQRGRCPACRTAMVMTDAGLIVRPGTEALPAGVIAGALKDGPAVLYCGAGVSMGPPTCAPSWHTLTSELLRAVFTKAPVELPDLVFHEIDRQPEEILENFATILGDRFPEVFSILDRAPLNPSQRAIARLAAAGRVRAIFTTNFDLYFERALKAEGVEFTRLVTNGEYQRFYEAEMPGLALCKLHGTIDHPETIAAVASQIRAAKGFSESKALTLAQFLSESPVVFSGYSGWDFDHNHYRAFWQAVGEHVKRVIWNLRPGESGGPDLKAILKPALDRTEFTSAEMPGVWVEVCRILGVPADDFEQKLPPQDESQKEAGKRRRKFWTEWAGKIPTPHLVSLCITDSLMFSQQWKTYRGKQGELDIGAGLEIGERMTALAGKLSAGELSPDEFMAQQQELLLDAHLNGVPEQSRTHAREVAVAEKAQLDATDFSTFMSYFSQYARHLDAVKAASRARAALKKHNELTKAQSRESRWLLQVLNAEATLSGLAPDDLQTARKELLGFVKRAVAGELDDDGFAAALQQTVQRHNNAQMGVPDYDGLFQILVREAAKWENRSEALDAVCITLLASAEMGITQLEESREYREMLARIFDGSITIDMLDRLDDVIVNDLRPLIKRIPGGEKGWLDWARVDLGTVAALIAAFQWLGVGMDREYLSAWKNGGYPRRRAPQGVGEWLKHRFMGVWERFDRVPSRYRQHLCAYGAILGEMIDDFELCKMATDKAIELAGGKVTESVRAPIPECLAAFYERRNELESAAEYYDLALNGLKLAISRGFADAVVYRAFKCHVGLGAKERALRIALDYSPAFGDGITWTRMPCRDMLITEAHELARELGYESAHAALTAMAE